MRVKNSFFIFALCAVFAILLITSCFSPYEGEGGIVINIGEQRAFTFTPESVLTLSHTITARSASGIEREKTGAKAGSVVSMPLPPGRWNIDVVAYDGEEAAAHASASGVVVKIGKYTNVDLSMFVLVPLPEQAGLYRTVAVGGAETYERVPAGRVPANDMGAAAAYVNSNPASYLMLLDADVPAPAGGYTLNAGSLALSGLAETRAIAFSGRGGEGQRLFTVNSGASLTLGNNARLGGAFNGGASIVLVNAGGNLVMKAGSFISGDAAGTGRAVSVAGGAFLMEGGMIEGNVSSTGGGGVLVSGGSFVMKGGSIERNVSSTKNGGGVFVSGGSFVMEGGSIERNDGLSGGVYINENGRFTMSGGAISLNSGDFGGAVRVQSGVFEMTGGNSAGNDQNEGRGGGVYLDSAGTFTMSGGLLFNNSSSVTGGGVNMEGGAFSLSGSGKISENSAAGNLDGLSGGGVYVAGGTFTMTGGELYKNKATGANGSGGAIAIGKQGKAVMSSGRIYENKATTGSGGGVVIDGNGTSFTMTGGDIAGNYAEYSGGGVYAGSTVAGEGCLFTMTSGVIHGNTAIAQGGGVYINITGGGHLVKNGGTILGSDPVGDWRNNTADNGSGDAVFLFRASDDYTYTDALQGEEPIIDTDDPATVSGWASYP